MIAQPLGLVAGEAVEVRSEAEILCTLDAAGKLEGLPFMPEMLQFCGTRTQVYRRANKTCDTVNKNMARRMENTVHLESLRCDGSGHGQCEAGCLLYWKEAWLKRPAASPRAGTTPHTSAPLVQLTRAGLTALCSNIEADGETRYRCQATELPGAGARLEWWEPGQYFRELTTRNIGLGTFLKAMAISWFNAIQRWRGGLPYPYVEGFIEGKTPDVRLDLEPGEFVRVRSIDEIRSTLSVHQRNRGLWFDVEMVPYCGGEYRVQRRVNRIIDERTGRIMTWPGDCIVLDGVVCNGCLSRNRLFCTRAITPYWREIWLERVVSAGASTYLGAHTKAKVLPNAKPSAGPDDRT